MYIYSKYWGTWSRILGYTDLKGNIGARLSGDYPWVIEVNLTPVNPGIPESWDEVTPIRIRIHGTTCWGHEPKEAIPDVIKQRMRDEIGNDLACVLLYQDLLPLIDLGLAHKLSNGGTNLSDCLRR
jgi:hypothetical protein